MAAATIVVRGTLGGKRVNWGVERARREGLKGTFWIKWKNGTSQKWDGPHKDEWAAKAAKARRERELKQIALGLPVADSGKRITLSEAIARFLEVKRTESQDGRSADRWKWELELFQQVSGKTYVDEILKEDSYKYWRHFQDRKREPRTIYNRLCSINRFLSDSICNVAADRRLSVKEMPSYDESAVDYYSQEDLKRLFAACTAEERLAYQFFLYSGCREREVMFATWRDVDFDGCTFTIQAKQIGHHKFSTKNNKPRIVPIPSVLVEALRTYKLINSDRQLIFVNRENGPEGHFLYKLKQIASRAQLNCGHCVTGSYDEWGNLTPGTEKYCKNGPYCSQWTLHRFRRTWATWHLQNGVPITDVQEWIGHSDQTTLRRYLGLINVKSDRAKAHANNLAALVEV
ncbi:MAG: site-specific integrase [Acidobacteriia bacterium]|nr:site-specific integrase [Terriglobia bacterium]